MSNIHPMFPVVKSPIYNPLPHQRYYMANHHIHHVYRSCMLTVHSIALLGMPLLLSGYRWCTSMHRLMVELTITYLLVKNYQWQKRLWSMRWRWCCIDWKCFDMDCWTPSWSDFGCPCRKSQALTKLTVRGKYSTNSYIGIAFLQLHAGSLAF